MSRYDFNRQHSQGKDAERFIYQTFQGRFNVIPAPAWLQDQGVDFTFNDLSSRHVYKVELKTDTRARVTGNAFIETVSISRPGEPEKPGWVYTSISDYLLYFLPNAMPPIIYRIHFDHLRSVLPGWLKTCEYKRIPNTDLRRGDYETIGVLVPLEELNRIAQEVIEL